MNNFGRVFGGFLVLISLGWLATIAGIRPVNSNNQLNSSPAASNADTPVSNADAPAKITSGTTPAPTSKAQTSTFSTNNTGGTKTTPTVEQNPRDANPSDQSGTTPPPPEARASAPAATQPISAGW